ncbi:hypothetical protein ACFPM0_25490 [Pseudonocardia sulfidoxydans]|uniref:hypothetical protein n=1 Tax=Pseudonocardia sulfidoxydans TaxID=54011 RepID=UPI003609B395
MPVQVARSGKVEPAIIAVSAVDSATREAQYICRTVAADGGRVCSRATTSQVSVVSSPPAASAAAHRAWVRVASEANSGASQ